MIPLNDRTPRRSTPFLTLLLVVANVLVFGYQVQLLLAGGPLDAFMQRYAFDYAAFTSGLASEGLTSAVITPLFSHMFLHGGWLHLGANMLYLWVFGRSIEDRLGHLRFLALYLAAGIVAAITQGLVQPAPMVGASGAIAGLLGAYLLTYPGARIQTLVFLGLFITVIDIPAVVVIGFWALVQFLQGLAELRLADTGAGVAYFAHIGGFIAGIVLLLLLRPARRRYGY